MDELNLRKISEDDLRGILEKHKKWLNGEDDGEKADLRNVDFLNSDLRGVDLRWSNLQGSNLQGADIDFSCWPLWCGSLDVIVDKRIAAQLAYHFCRLVCDDDEVKQAQKMLAPLANRFHREEECGRIEE